MWPEARAIAVALPSCAGNAGNIYGAYLFPAESAPKYLIGFGMFSGTLGLGAAVLVLFHCLMMRRKQD
ncbi:hypothetical protein B0T17DRAFT_535229 [Bombardia bombarda]|uniref:Tartrate transporter n=1 Tax=Bombardia bombarda TaxID=252184 RepID=A0AA39WUG6_9PEZI|nr:hypothetical protein B0T17DRAFT_535229 [Bombardia bombarda]